MKIICPHCNSENIRLISKFSKKDGDKFVCNDCNFVSLKIPLETGHIDHVIRCINVGRIIYEREYDLNEGEIFYLNESINPNFHSNYDNKMLEILLEKYKEDSGCIPCKYPIPSPQAEVFISFPLNAKIAPIVSDGASDLC